MTGNEKKDNLYREAALGVMLVLLFVMRGSRLVMLYALCVQALLEGGGEILVCLPLDAGECR